MCGCVWRMHCMQSVYMQNHIEHIITISRWLASPNIKKCSKCKHAHVCLCALNTTLFMWFGGDETIPKQLMLAFFFVWILLARFILLLQIYRTRLVKYGKEYGENGAPSSVHPKPFTCAQNRSAIRRLWIKAISYNSIRVQCFHRLSCFCFIRWR